MNKEGLYFTAAEPSGDLFAAEIMAVIQAKAPHLPFRAAGGHKMAEHADMLPLDLSPLAVLGFWEGIKAYQDVKRLSLLIAEDIIAASPKAAILVDAWGTSLRVAKHVRAHNPSIKLIKVIGPQVWASRPGRAKTLAGAVDHLLCLHDFEKPYYAPYGLKTTTIGHPAFGRIMPGNADRFRQRYDISEYVPLLLVLPGSRPAEIARVAPPLIEAAKQAQDDHSELRVCVAPATSVLPMFQEAFSDLPSDWTLLTQEDERFDAMAAATAALSCSGTVNLELAIQKTPFVTGYRIGNMSWLLLKHFMLRTEYITLINHATSRMVAPEFLQDAFTPEVLYAAIRPYLLDTNIRRAQIETQLKILEQMGLGQPPAAERAAEIIMEEVELYMKKTG